MEVQVLGTRDRGPEDDNLGLAGASEGFNKLGLLALQGRRKAIGGLKPQLHQDLEADAEQSVGQRITANDFRQEFADEDGRLFRVGHGDKQPHANFVPGLAGMKIDARSRDTHSRANVLEGVTFGIGRPDTHQLCDLAATTAPALRMG